MGPESYMPVVEMELDEGRLAEAVISLVESLSRTHSRLKFLQMRYDASHFGIDELKGVRSEEDDILSRLLEKALILRKLRKDAASVPAPPKEMKPSTVKRKRMKDDDTLTLFDSDDD